MKFNISNNLRNKIFIATLASFTLAKITSIDTNINKTAIDKDNLESTISAISSVFDTLYISSIKAFDLVNLGVGFEGTSHILNFLITYIPFFLILLFAKDNFKKVDFSFFKKFFKKKDKVKKDPNYFLLKIVLGKNFNNFS